MMLKTQNSLLQKSMPDLFNNSKFNVISPINKPPTLCNYTQVDSNCNYLFSDDINILYSPKENKIEDPIEKSQKQALEEFKNLLRDIEIKFELN